MAIVSTPFINNGSQSAVPIDQRGRAMNINTQTIDSGKVRMGAISQTLATADAGKVRMGAIARTL